MIKVNGRERDFVPNTTIAQLLEQMGYNLTTDGDFLEVVSFVGGG